MVAFYVILTCRQHSDICDTDIEGLFIEISLPKTKPILVGNIYRPPDSAVDYLSELDDVFQKCNDLYDDVYIWVTSTWIFLNHVIIYVK